MGIKRSLIFGVGINDWDGSITDENGRNIKEYLLWRSMLCRCFGKKRQDSYIGVSCDPSWFSLKSFIGDVSLIKNYELSSTSKWELDKDILIDGNKIYSKDTVCFVPKEINSLFKCNYSQNSSLPNGVTQRRGNDKFYVSISLNGKTKYIGTFNSVLDAEIAFNNAKIEHILNAAKKWRGIIADNVYDSMLRHVTTLAELKEM